MSERITSRRAPRAEDPALREAKALFKEYLRSGTKRPLFSCVPQGPGGGVTPPDRPRSTYFAPDSTAFQMAAELVALGGRNGPQKVVFPAFELGTSGELFAAPSASLRSDLQLTVTVDPRNPQRPQEHEFQLRGKGLSPALGYVRQTFSTKPFTFDANGEAMVTGKTGAEILVGPGRPPETIPEQDFTLRCKLE